jgi:hypothetical protein
MVVVTSAMSGETNRLIGLAREIMPKPTPRELDALMATGEQVTITLLAMALEKRGCPARSYTGSQIAIHTDGTPNKARIQRIDRERIDADLAAGRVVVVAGFQGVDDAGNITTLGRGGSDTSAVALAAALKALGEDAEVVVAELVPGVVEWNQGPLGDVAGRPLDDPRTRVSLEDVGELLRREPGGYDAIMLDVDNGPEGLTHRDNDWLYSSEGLEAASEALRDDGVLAVWSAGQDPGFTERLKCNGWVVEEVTVRAHRPGKGARHWIWLAY